MSKKPARSERQVDLPDWADEVTPADEVMRKFYAPTGAFKPGPIAVQPPDAALATSAGAEDKEADLDVQVAPLVPADTAAISTSSQASVSEPQDARGRSSLTSSEGESHRTARRKPLNPRTTQPVTLGSVEASEATPFAEFAKKWSRYLYPGQLAVMRELYELTIASGVTDCFTRYSELAAATKMTRRNCINVVNALVERGFVERLEVRNDATGKGIKLRIHTEPQP